MKTIFMTKADHERWDKNLRSGEYKQGTCRLELDGRFCCLGVEQHGRMGTTEELALPSLEYLKANNIGFRGKHGNKSLVPYLPSLKRNAAEANDGMLYDDMMEPVTNQRFSFVEIADAIADCVEYTD